MANPDYHSIRIIPDSMELKNSNGYFNGVHTWRSWHLIPSTRPVINPPAFKTNYISIPGGNGSIDASTVLTKYPVYEDRTGSIEFYVIRDYDEYGGWEKVYQSILNYLHGGLFKVILDDDPDYFYRGRLTVNTWKSEKDWSKITIDYHFEPFKYELMGSWEGEYWEWDPFDFVDGVIPGWFYYNNIEITGLGANHVVRTIDFDFTNFTMPVIPTIVVTPKASVDGHSPDPQTPSHIVFKHYKKQYVGYKYAAYQMYTYKDTVIHSHKPYNIILVDDAVYNVKDERRSDYIEIEADEGARFTVSFRFRRGLL